LPRHRLGWPSPERAYVTEIKAAYHRLPDWQRIFYNDIFLHFASVPRGDPGRVRPVRCLGWLVVRKRRGSDLGRTTRTGPMQGNLLAENAGHIVKLDLRCASDAYKFELSSNIMQTGDSLSGNWFESTHRVGGSISGRNTGREINARAEGDTFTALLTVKTNGHRQVFLMESPGAKVSQVSINLSQAPK
jgi:hypothetical protein